MKKTLLLISTLLNAQEVYEGQITFDYFGTESGYFSSFIQDTLTSGVCISQNNADNSNLLIASITEQLNNQFDLFLAVLQDTTYPLQPRTWDIPGEGDEDNPISLETLVVFIPGLDSSFVLDLFDSVIDTNSTSDTTSIFDELFESLSSNLYLGLQGQVEIYEVTDSLILGAFNSVLIKPAFNIPPHIVSINNGEINFSRAFSPDLSGTSLSQLPINSHVKSIFPNPFNSRTTIKIENPENAVFDLCIYDISGKKLKTIYSGSPMIGTTSFIWDSKNHSSGLYFAVFESNQILESKKMVLVK